MILGGACNKTGDGFGGILADDMGLGKAKYYLQKGCYGTHLQIKFFIIE